MAISFNNVPPGARASNIYIEVAGVKTKLDNLFIPETVGIVGMYDPLKTGVINYDPVKVTSKDQVGLLFGFGSHAHRQALQFDDSVFLQGGGVYVFPVPEAGGAVAATKDVTFVTDATSSGTWAFEIGGVRVTAAVANGDSPTVQAAALADAITNSRDIAVTATNLLGVVTITAKFKGLVGNDIYIKLNPASGDEDKNPSGTTVTGVDDYLASGATDPDVGSVFFDVGGEDKLGDRWYTLFTCPFSDATNLGNYKLAGDGRNDPAIHRAFGAAVGYTKETYSQALALAATINSEWISPIWDDRVYAPAWELSAREIGLVADYANQSPARPYKTLATNLSADVTRANLTTSQADALFKSGMSYCKIDGAGVHRLGDLALSYRTNDAGGDATDWFEFVELTLRQAKLYSIEQVFLTDRYARAVAVDNQTTSTADYVIAPKDVVSDLTKLVNDLWAPLGWSKNSAQIIAGITAEINVSNNGRIDSTLLDDEAKALRILAHRYTFKS